MPGVGAALASGDVGVVVFLVDGAGNLGDVDDGNVVRDCVFNEPLIEPSPADGEWGNLCIHFAGENENVDGGVMAGETWGELAEFECVD